MKGIHVKKSPNWNQAATCKADAEEDDVEASVPDEPSIRVNCLALRLFASTTCDVLFHFVFHFYLLRLFASTICHVGGNCEKRMMFKHHMQICIACH